MVSYDLDELSERVPVAVDSTIMEFSSRLRVVEDHVDYRARRPWYKRLWESAVGTEAQRQNRIDQSLAKNQRVVFDYLEKLADNQRITDTALVVTQDKLLETRDAVRQIHAEVGNLSSRVDRIEQRFTAALDAVTTRLDTVEKELERLSVVDVLTGRIDAWAAGRTYRGLPWILQVMFVVTETIHALGPTKLSKSDLREEVRTRLADKIVAELRNRDIGGSFALKSVVADQLRDLTDKDGEMTLALMDPRRSVPVAAEECPIEFFVGSAQELRAAGRPTEEAAEVALTVAEQMHAGPPQRVFRVPDFVNAAIDERIESTRQTTRTLVSE